MSYVTLWPWPLTRWPWKFVVHQASCYQSVRAVRGWIIIQHIQLCSPLLMISRFFAHVMSRCDHDLWLLDVGYYSTSIFMCLNSVQNLSEIDTQLSYWRFSTFTPCNFMGWGIFAQRFSGVRGPNFTKLGEDIKRIPHGYTISLFQSSDLLLHFKRRRLKFEWCWKRKRPKISHSSTPVKSRGWVDKISIPIVEALPMTEPPEYIWWSSTLRLLSTVDL